MNTFVLALTLAISIPVIAGAGEDASPSPATLRVEAAQKVLEKQPNRYQAENDLAIALIRRTRETGDKSYDQQAQAAIERSLKIQPENFEAGQAHVALLLAEHRYHSALDEARTLNHRMPDAVLVWGDLAEAQAALGDYKEAEAAAQWMMNLRPGNLPAYLCGAALRQDWGDMDGALDFLSKALQQTPPFETEETAWILTQMAQVHRQMGRPAAAETLLKQALQTFPGYYLSQEELAQVWLSQHRFTEAADLLGERNRNFPSPFSHLLAARALDGSGKQDDAAKTYAEFEQEARAQITQPENSNRELIGYYIETAHQPQEALRIARLELENQRDVATLDAYAWALFANGNTAEARQQIQKVLADGTADAVIFYHAGAIEAAAGNRAGATHNFQQSLDLNPTSEVAEQARRGVSQSGNYTAVRYTQDSGRQ
jgi:tetratricopeptide (TPR) repeat protein